jgi:DNA topoisomerase-1
VAFPPPYEYRGLTVRIKGEALKLDPTQEEMLMAWAKKKDTPYVHDAVFQKNFLGDFKKVLPKHLSDISLSDIDWSELHAIAEREKTANLSPEEKKKRSAERKALREEMKANFGTAVIDETECEIGAYMVEPPGILMGRGEHPLRGKWKPRVEPEQVTLNLDKEAPLPPAPEGHAWKETVHEHDSMWVASWYDELAKKRKYVWLADSANLRQERDKEKYVKAAKLESSVERVRDEIRKSMEYSDARAHTALNKRERKLRDEIKALQARILKASAAGDQEGRKKAEDERDALRQELENLERQRERLVAAETKTRKIATVSYLIDRLAMRVGDEKDEDEADTVGASTLRVEHIKIGDDRIEFDFLGKDSVQWQKFLPLDDNERALARNLQEFTKGKQPGEQIFDKIYSTHVNRFLSSIVPGLTAKVFRTYHATTTVRNCLRENGNTSQQSPVFEKEYAAKLANLEAAIACNHKRTPPKNWEQSLEKKEKMVEQLRANKPNLEKLRTEIEKREAALDKLLEEQKKLAAAPRAIREKEAALAELQAQPEPESTEDKAKLEKQRAAARKALEKAKEDFEKKTGRMDERIAKAREALEHAQAAPERSQRDYDERVEKAELQLKLAKATRDYNLGTSLKNYIDPRVYKAWGDYVGFDWKRLYTKQLQRKFAWANQSRLRWNAPNGDSAAEAAEAAEAVDDTDLDEEMSVSEGT